MLHMRPYNSLENKNIAFLVNKQIDFTTIQITETGMKKSILDATIPVRTYFLEKKLHDYEQQRQGISGKIMIKTFIFNEFSVKETKCSLYRPETKHGDPRLWIYGINDYITSDDILAMIVFENALYVVNLNKNDISNIVNSNIDNPLKDFIFSLANKKKTVAEELLTMIKKNIPNWVESEILADTGIGRTIESLLGISMNSSKSPDYKGIELKSKRERSVVRSTLFSQVPDWEKSKFKNSDSIVEKYGYFIEALNHKALHVTVKAQKVNPQNLSLNIDYDNNYLELIEMMKKDSSLLKVNDISVWSLITLHKRLLDKHRETFWIDVETSKRDGKEFFRISEIEHTKNPISSQFDLLLDQGKISVDLLLKRSHGGDTFGFKINKTDRKYLFPESEKYVLH